MPIDLGPMMFGMEVGSWKLESLLPIIKDLKRSAFIWGLLSTYLKKYQYTKYKRYSHQNLNFANL
jgi:hypothetical protein